ncbi:MAG: hypothetical protein CFE21_09410 [Bacteroidetes bacterium B1(2017)]|nr:MAG: hypothetical protein CFE21_09410 [Bacteroidetes bacterium B1(2017)]
MVSVLLWTMPPIKIIKTLKSLQSKIIVAIISLLTISCSKNPCSLSSEKLAALNWQDSVLSLPETREHIKAWDKASYDEPSLFEATNESYRYKLGSHDYSEIIRIEKRDNNYFVTKKVFNGMPGDPNTKPVIQNFQVSIQTWDSLTNSLKEMDFWTYCYIDTTRYLDGYTCSIEAFNPIKNKCTSKNYHVIGGNCPKDSNFLKMCKLFKQLK